MEGTGKGPRSRKTKLIRTALSRVVGGFSSEEGGVVETGKKTEARQSRQ